MAGVAIVAALAGAAVARSRAPAAGELARLHLHLADTIRVALVSPTLVAVSPAGDRIAMSSNGGGPIRLTSLSDPVSRPVAGTERGMTPVFSPDGRDLAFTRGGSVHRVPVDGGTPIVVSDSASMPMWGDGGTLFFRRRLSFWALRPGASRPERLVPFDTSVGRVTGVGSVLPGEKFLLVDLVRPDRRTGVIVTVDLSSGRIDSTGIIGTNPRWSATGHLVYVDSMKDVVAVPFSARTRRATGAPVVVVRGVRTGYYLAAQYAISQRGQLLAIPDSGANRLQLLMVTASGDARPVSSELRSFSWMRISPDGRRAAFEIAEGVAGPWNLWTMDLGSGILTRLTSGNVAIRPHGWTPDSRNVFYLMADSLGDVAVRPADGTGQPRRVASFPRGVMHGSVDAGGQSLVVRSGATTILARLDSAAPPRVLFDDASAGPSPSISPDGKLIAYTSEESGRQEVYVRAIDGVGGRERVSINGGLMPLWNRAGTAVFYRDDVAVRRAAIARVPTLAVTRRDSLFPAGEYGVGGMTWGVMPDDQHFLMVRDRTSATYPVLVLNWTRLFDR